jgi:hypothetical protein
MEVFRISPQGQAAEEHFVVVRAPSRRRAIDLAAVWADEWGQEGSGVQCRKIVDGGFRKDGPAGIIFPFPELEMSATKAS